LRKGFLEKAKAEIKKNTVLLYGETPANPTMDILDIEAFASLGKV
jgi:cystathionine beta-lyase/cystathionine gamma-synthase